MGFRRHTPKEVYDKINQQQIMGPVEQYGKVRMTGKFEYGGKYGHIGGYDQQITPTFVIISGKSIDLEASQCRYTRP